MNKLKFYSIGIIISTIFLGCEPICTINSADITNMYSSYVEGWKTDISKAFDEAEKEIFNKKPIPEDLAKPDPDVTKCICKGTGIITHGDGHKTPCEFHGIKKVETIFRKESHVR